MEDLLWLDLETTGLDHERDDILMVAAARTNDAGEIIASREWVVARHASIKDLGWSMLDPVVMAMHTENGLLARVDSAEAVSLFPTVSEELLKFIGPGRPVLAGSSIHFDRAFVKERLEVVDRALHYRMLDVSALRIAASVWGMPEYPKMKSKHLALDDIKASIAEFMHWGKVFGMYPGAAKVPALLGLCSAPTCKTKEMEHAPSPECVGWSCTANLGATLCGGVVRPEPRTKCGVCGADWDNDGFISACAKG